MKRDSANQERVWCVDIIRTAAFSFLFMALILGGILPSSAEARRAPGKNIPESFSAISESANPAVVNISTVKIEKGGGRMFHRFFGNPGNPYGQDEEMRDFFDRFFGNRQQREYKHPSLGSGFIIDKDGYIVTNNHVIENADQIKVILSDEEEYDAEIVGRDSNTDIALIKIKPGRDLPTIKLGDSEALKVGEWVVAIGNPFAFGHTVTAGIVSAKGRVIGIGPYDDLIQTDASINPGNSGGPLLDMEGKVVGINTAIVAAGQGIGFAVPINLAKGVLDQLKEKGEVTRGWLGVKIQDLTEELTEYYGLKSRNGVLVRDVIPGDPADEAGIRPRDVIVEINGEKIEDMKELLAIIAATDVGDTVRIKAFRDGDYKTYRVKVGRRVEDQVAFRRQRNGSEDDLGLRVSEITPDSARRYNIDETEGVLIDAVDSNGQGADAGLRPGDIIKEIDRVPIRSIQQYRQIVRDAKKGETVILYVRRPNQRDMVVKLTK